MTSNDTKVATTKQSMQNHAIIILASGLSLRLGQPKQLLSINGDSLINYMIKLALVTQPQTVIIVIPDNNPTVAHAIDELIIEEPKIQAVINPIPETGMAHSLSLGIEALTHFDNRNELNNSNNHNSESVKRVLIMGIDQILLGESHLTYLLAGKHNVVASSYSNWQLLDTAPSTGEPKSNIKNDVKNDIVGLPLVIDYPLLKQWQSALNGDKGLRYLIRALPPNQINIIANHQLSYDIDTPEQLNFAKQQGWLDI